MKRYLYIYIFIVIAITSCTESTLQEEESKYIDVSFSTYASTVYIDDMQQSRSGEDNAATNVRYVVEAWSQDETPVLYYRGVETTEDLESVLNHTIHIVAGTYDFLFWADYVDADASDTTADKHYDTSGGLMSVAIKNTKYAANDISRDCFATNKKDVKVSSTINLGTIELSRPMTVLVVKNSGESVEGGEDISISFTESEPESESEPDTTIESIPSGYNILDETVIYDKTITPNYGETTAEDDELAFDYIFISKSTLYDVTIDVGEVQKTSYSTPFELNKKTNIIANFF